MRAVPIARARLNSTLLGSQPNAKRPLSEAHPLPLPKCWVYPVRCLLQPEADMRRRKFFTFASGIVAWPLVAHGQTSAAPHVGVLRVADSASQPSHQDLLSGLRDLGYIEGQNVVIEFRSAEGQLELLPELAAELVRLKVADGAAPHEPAGRCRSPLSS